MSKLNPNAGEWVPTFSVPAASPTISSTTASLETTVGRRDQTPIRHEAALQENGSADVSINSKTAFDCAAEVGHDIAPAENEDFLLPYEGSSPLHNRFIYSIAYLLKFRPLSDRVLHLIPNVVKNPMPPKKLGHKVQGTMVYSRPELLQFQSLYAMMPKDFKWAHKIGANAVIRESQEKRGKKDKGRQRPGVVSYDASLVGYFNPTEYTTAMNMGLYTGPPPDTPSDTLDGKSKLSVSEPVNPVEEAIIAKRRMAMLLNDVQSQTLTCILEAFMGISITCVHTLQEIIGLLFDRAIAHPDLSELYATLCTGLSTRTPEFKEGARTINFRRILLTKCYESILEEPVDPPCHVATKPKTSGTSHAWRRKCMLQNVGLVSALFRRQLLTENVMHVCVAMMLDDEVQPQADIIEAACGLLHLVGDLLDGSSPASRRTMNEYFAVLDRIAENCQLPDRVQQMITDLKAVRAGNWIKSRHENLLAPRTPVASPAKVIDSMETNGRDSPATAIL